jgi:hypothetical protein
MGCTQTSVSDLPPNHINHIPIERLHNNEGRSMMKASPVVVITAPPTPSYIKSALKKFHPDGRGRTERLPFFNWKPPPINKVVNFDEQVLVKARTPTPSKTWYEKASSTMPVKKHRRDDEKEDYDDDDIPSISSDEEEEENNEQIDTESRIPILRSPALLQQNEPNTFWQEPNTIGFMPTTNMILENESFSPTMQRSSYKMNTYPTETRAPTPINRIKVRRKLPDFGPPEIVPTSLYRAPLQSLTIPPYQSLTQTSRVPAYQSPPQTSFFSPYQSSVQLSTLPSYQSSLQSSAQLVQQTLPNPNAILIEQQPTLTNDESSPQTASYAINRHPIENVT